MSSARMTTTFGRGAAAGTPSAGGGVGGACGGEAEGRGEEQGGHSSLVGG